jgi:hypothetical protein
MFLPREPHAPITIQAVAAYLTSLFAKPVHLISMTGEDLREAGRDLKAFGYGSPLFLEYEVAGERKKAVLETMAPSSFGHDHFSDRAQAILWEHSAFNNLPKHVRSIDSGAILDSGGMISTGRAREFFLLAEFAHGRGYSTTSTSSRKTGSTWKKISNGPWRSRTFSWISIPVNSIPPLRPKDPRPPGPRRVHHGADRQLSEDA